VASLKDIRRRIGSVKNTQQITKAMKMVSAAKLRRAQELIVGARPFADKIEELTSRILSELERIESDKSKLLHPLLRQEVEQDDSLGEKPKAVLLVISSDKGLCGAYNTNVIKMALKHYELLKEKYDLRVLCAGRKAAEALKKRGIEIEVATGFWSAPLTQTRVAALGKDLVEDFLQQKIERIEIVYTEFRSAISFTARTRQILPLEVKKAEVGAATDPTAGKAYMFRPSKEELLSSLLPKQVVLQMYRCFADALASEFGARMTSMDNATRNSADMITDLTLLANSLRQASITTELMEIVGGAEALKG
jgi:F-type H+-transporting ATPase subunit gamma